MQAMFKDANYNMKVHIKVQFCMLVLPETTYLHPPPRNDTKGAPKKDKHVVLSKRDHLHSRIMLTLTIQIQVSQSKSIGSNRKSACKSNMSPNVNPPLVKVDIPHIDKILLFNSGADLDIDL